MSGNQKNLDNRSGQLNTNNEKFYSSRGMDERPSDWATSNYGSSGNSPTQRDLDNHSNQKNPNNPEYGHSRSAGSKK
ncbi:unnamed protein product [Ceutorhynchus assimilis]|uniref:Uncharacterized protein n=1 Tax=Ceutorhynchus assimilis TaxID=467358 RepID=A0A9N9MJJ6_9CUCU|nr:unnamed protein product [Ceutorhynchus assimilis]